MKKYKVEYSTENNFANAVWFGFDDNIISANSAEEAAIHFYNGFEENVLIKTEELDQEGEKTGKIEYFDFN